ncbi:MAG: hypothetical protein LKE34_00595 [Bacteroidales bacterium]|jgi:hypothetical protein|nr:hypothetical protein [Bacteroidales bacterium]
MQVRAQGIEAVEARLLVYHLLIERVAVVLGWLPVNGAGFVLDEASWVVLPLEVDKSPPRGLGGSVLKEPRDILTRINDRTYLERCSTLSLTSQQSGVVSYAFDRIITEIEENEK